MKQLLIFLIGIALMPQKLSAQCCATYKGSAFSLELCFMENGALMSALYIEGDKYLELVVPDSAFPTKKQKLLLYYEDAYKLEISCSGSQADTLYLDNLLFLTSEYMLKQEKASICFEEFEHPEFSLRLGKDAANKIRVVEFSDVNKWYSFQITDFQELSEDEGGGTVFFLKDGQGSEYLLDYSENAEFIVFSRTDMGLEWKLKSKK